MEKPGQWNSKTGRIKSSRTWSGSFFFKQLFVIRTFGFLPFVPPCKIQAIIIPELFVVKRMMCSAYQPSSQEVAVKIPGVDLYVKMVDNTAKGHDGQLQKQYIDMHGQYQ
jgi:hypothetical protein